MQDTSKLIGENGFLFVDDSCTDETIYMIYVQTDAVFTTLEEKNKSTDTPVDVLTETNLTGKTVKAGGVLTPFREYFHEIVVSSGELICYRLGQ